MSWPHSSNADLMKKGLRHTNAGAGSLERTFKRGPDEEGIETRFPVTRTHRQSSNADLMKKGLRQNSAIIRASLARFKRGPDEEGIETSQFIYCSFVHPFKRGPDEEGIETYLPRVSAPTPFKRGPDEEGIETPAYCMFASVEPVQTRT